MATKNMSLIFTASIARHDGIRALCFQTEDMSLKNDFVKCLAFYPSSDNKDVVTGTMLFSPKKIICEHGRMLRSLEEVFISTCSNTWSADFEEWRNRVLDLLFQSSPDGKRIICYGD